MDINLKSLNHGDKVKFIYNDEILYGKIDGYSFIDIDRLMSINKQCCTIALDKRYKVPDKEYSICGMVLHIDLNKDIVSDNDGYYMVEEI